MEDTEQKSKFEDELSKMEGGQFEKLSDIVEAEQRRRAGGSVGEEIDAEEVRRMSGSDFEAWQAEQGRIYERRIASMTPAELAAFKRGKG